MKLFLISILKHINRFGVIRGLVIFVKARLVLNAESKLNLPNLLHPIYLRKNTSDLPTFNQVMVDAEYSFNIRNNSPKFIIDCGANIGLASLFFLSRYTNATIIAIEPEKSNFKQLLKNTCNYSNIKCVNSGIWNRTTELEVIDKRNFGHWGFQCEEVDEPNDKTIKAASIDDILDKFDISEIDLLKIDIEGAELELFSKNYENWLPKTKVIMIELHDAYRIGCSKSFFSAIIKYDFSVFNNGENIICIKN